MSGIELIAKERKEQIEKHGRTIESDVEINQRGELSAAAATLISASGIRFKVIPIGWDNFLWKKMCDKPYKDRLIIAGALIAAEIDRIQFMETDRGI